MRYCKIVYWLLSTLILLVLCSCKENINTNNHLSFNDLGELVERFDTAKIEEPDSIEIFLEASGSMNGFYRAGIPTNFKRDIWSLVSEFRNQTETVLLFSDAMANCQKMHSDIFRDKMNAGNLVSSNSTDVPSMIKTMIRKLDEEENSVCMLVSDLKYSPVGLGSPAVLMQQYTTDIINIFKSKPYSISLFGLTSQYFNSDGSERCAKSPYYILIIGREQNLRWVRNKIYNRLHTEVIGVSDFGMNMGTPQYSILPIKNRTGVISNLSKLPLHALTSYDKIDSATFWVAINTKHLPLKIDYCKHIDIKAVYGSHVEVVSVDTVLDLALFDPIDTTMIRTIGATILIKCKLSNMTSDSEVVEIFIPDDPNQNKWIEAFYGAQQESECLKTISIEGLINGIDNSLKSSKICEKSMKILVSKKNI